MTKRRKKKKMRNGIGVVEGSDAGNAEDDVGETTARKRKMRTKSEDVEGGGENVGVGRKKKMMTKRRKKKKRRTGIGVVEEDTVVGRRKKKKRRTGIGVVEEENDDEEEEEEEEENRDR